MAKATPRTIAKLRDLFEANPGWLDVQDTPDGDKTSWKGGRIAKLLNEVVPIVKEKDQNGELPFGINWLAYCKRDNAWYISRIDDDPNEVPLD